MKYKNIIFCVILLIASCNKQKESPLLKVNDSTELLEPSLELEKQSNMEKIEISDYSIKGDTLWIVSGDKFLYYPFGAYQTIDELSAVYPFMNKKQLLNNNTLLDNLYFNRSSIVTLLNSDDSDKIEIVDAKISDSEIFLVNGIRVGLNKSLFMNYLPISLQKDDLDKIHIMVLESELLGIWNYYYFSGNKLDSILFKTDYQYDLNSLKEAKRCVL